MAKNKEIEKEDIVQEEVLDETSAGDTLKPGGGSNPSQNGFGRLSKSELLGKMMRVVGAMKKDDLSSFLTKTLDQVGHETDGQPSTAEKNKQSVSMNPVGEPTPFTSTVKEDVEELFDGQEDLTEEFKTKAATLFEAAVQNRVDLEVAKLEEEFETKLDEQVTEAIDELHEQVNKYTDYVAREWLKENKVELEQSYRASATEDFIEGLKGLFKEHYVEVPEEKLDVIGELEEKINELEEAVNEAKADNIKLSGIIKESELKTAFAEVSEGLADTQVEKLRSLAEGVDYKDISDYTEKLGMIKEQYFNEKTEKKTETGIINEESSIGGDDGSEEDKVVVPAEMKSYVSAISKTVKK